VVSARTPGPPRGAVPAYETDEVLNCSNAFGCVLRRDARAGITSQISRLRYRVEGLLEDVFHPEELSAGFTQRIASLVDTLIDGARETISNGDVVEVGIDRRAHDIQRQLGGHTS
jgi:hypothetical protein